MSALAALVRVLARRLQDGERHAIGLELSDGLVSSGEDESDPQCEPPRTVPDWTYICRALVDVSVHASNVVSLLEQERTFFNFTDIIHIAERLREQSTDAYNLLCAASLLDRPNLEAHQDLNTVRRQVDLRRAEIVEAELAPMQPVPAAGAATWTIDYRPNGGFLATSRDTGDGSVPWAFWGKAPTAASAAHILTWCFLDQPPVIKFISSTLDQPWVQTGRASDLSREGPSIKDLLHHRGPVYEQHLAACRSARERLPRIEHEADVKVYLSERATELNVTDPQLPESRCLDSVGSPHNRDHCGDAHTVQWVPTHLVVGTNHHSWGEFNGHRPRVPLDVVQGLLNDDLETFTSTFFGGAITLTRTPGWAGPLYHIGSNGTHRVHTARMLQLPWLAAEVRVDTIAPSWTLRDLVADDPDHRDKRMRRPVKQHVDEHAALVAGLLRREIIEGDLVDDGSERILRCRRLPAAWLLRSARHATMVNAVYEARYPGALAQLDIPTEVGTDPVAWTQWLRAS